jgi:hypothetical protein
MSLLEIKEIIFMRDSDRLPEAGGVGMPRGKKGVPGREDVTEDAPPEVTNVAATEALDDGITLDDLKLTLALFDACAQRGSFRLSEFSVVGRLSERFSNFISKSEGQEYNGS